MAALTRTSLIRSVGAARPTSQAALEKSLGREGLVHLGRLAPMPR